MRAALGDPPALWKGEKPIYLGLDILVTRTLSAEGSQNGVNVSVELLLEVILGAGACDYLLTESLGRSPEVLALADGGLYLLRTEPAVQERRLRCWSS